MGQNLVEGKGIEALIQSGEVSKQLMDFIKASVEQEQERIRKEEEDKKRKRRWGKKKTKTNE